MTEAVIRNKPGMASVKDMPILQDGPPPGGFAPVRFARRIPNKGPSAMAIFLAAFGAFSYGMYQVGKGQQDPQERTCLGLVELATGVGCVKKAGLCMFCNFSRNHGFETSMHLDHDFGNSILTPELTVN
ncbi:hypothetical protein OIU76_017434 [Salix suchowensis]|nr:hypothetical protein OIU76_017434 [Salix suchowensis]